MFFLNRHIFQIVLALTEVGLTEADVEFIKYFINIFMHYSADVMKVCYNQIIRLLSIL